MARTLHAVAFISAMIIVPGMVETYTLTVGQALITVPILVAVLALTAKRTGWYSE